MNARELHATLEVGKDFSTWVKDRIAAYGFTEGREPADPPSRNHCEGDTVRGGVRGSAGGSSLVRH